MSKQPLITLFFLFLCLQVSAQTQSFIENQGQWPENFDYKYVFGGGSVFLDETKLTIHLVKPQGRASSHGTPASPDAALTYIDHHAYHVHFEGANPNCTKSGSDKLETYHNYLLGNDSKAWRQRVPLYGEVTYHNIYPNIDLRFYFSKEGNLKYDFILQPGADPSVIKLRYEGVDDLELLYGNLMVRNSVEDVLESAPYAFQELSKGKTKVKCKYELDGDIVTYDLGRYKKDQPLVIDPKLIFSSYTGSSSDNFGFTATPSHDGSLYAGGMIYVANGTYPVTSGAYQVANRGGHADIGLSKFSADGTRLIYSTYIGGSGDEMPYSLFERKDGSLVILGATGSANFPVTPNAFQRGFKSGVRAASIYSSDNLLTFPNGVDMIVTILDSTGGSLLGSTFFGGFWEDGFNLDLDWNYGDKFRGEVIADSSGNVYFVSSTHSNDLPATSNAFLQSWGARQDGFACSLNEDLSTLRWCTYIGGNQNDNAFGVKLGKDGDVFVVGGTESLNMPFNTDAHEAIGPGTTDGYILNLSSTDGSFRFGTYNGTPAPDQNFLVDVDYLGDVYVLGQTRGLYPTDTSEYYNNPGSAQYINKFSPDLRLSLRAMVFGDSTHTKSNISPTAFMVDDCRNVFLSGWGGGINNTHNKNINGFTHKLPITNNAIQDQTDGSDFYFFVLDASWKKLNYATYFGGANNDHVDGGTSRFAKDGTIYQAVCGGCGGTTAAPFPTTPAAYARTNGSSNCNLAALKIDFEALEVVADVEADMDSSCVPYTANLNNLSYNADIYNWVIPGGIMVAQDISSIQVTKEGVQRYQLIAIDTTCGLRDTIELDLFGFRDTVHAQFSVDYDSCSNNFQVKITNESVDADFYEWDFGNGKTSTLKEPPLGYVNPGTYTIKLVTRNSYCQLEDSISLDVKFKKRINSSNFNITYEPCRDGAEVEFSAVGTDFQDYIWDFGDGDVASGKRASHDFSASGTFRVRLTLRDTICQRFFERDTTIEVFSGGYEPHFPNVFTPNNDGLNEHFGLPPNIPENYFSFFNMQVYNRWGRKLYETSKIDAPWDGTFDDGQMAEGVYFYIINLTDGCGTANEYKGFVHLLNKI